jgi:hypothetical protein
MEAAPNGCEMGVSLGCDESDRRANSRFQKLMAYLIPMLPSRFGNNGCATTYATNPSISVLWQT